MLPGNVSVVEQRSFASQPGRPAEWQRLGTGAGGDLPVVPRPNFSNCLEISHHRHFCPGDDRHVREGVVQLGRRNMKLCLSVSVCECALVLAAGFS